MPGRFTNIQATLYAPFLLFVFYLFWVRNSDETQHVLLCVVWVKKHVLVGWLLSYFIPSILVFSVLSVSISCLLILAQELREQPLSLAITFYASPSFSKVSKMVFLTTFKPAVFLMIVKPTEPGLETPL